MKGLLRALRGKWFSVALAVVLVIIVGLPLLEMIGTTVWSREGLLSLRELGSSIRPWRLFLRSLLLASAVTISTSLLGLIGATYLEISTSRIARLLATVSWVPLLIPPYLHAIAWINLFGGGIFRATNMEDVSTLSGDFFSIFGLGGVIVVLSMAFFPISLEIIRTGMRTLDAGLWEAGLVQAPPLRVYVRILLSLSKPFILGAALMVFILALGEYGVPSLLSVNTYPVEIFSRFSAFYDERAAVTACLPLTLVGITCVGILARLMKNRQYVSLQRRPGTLSKFPPPVPLPVLGVVTGTALMVGILVPLVGLLWEIKPGWTSMSAALLSARRAFGYTLVSSLGGAAGVVGLALLVAYQSTFGSRSEGTMLKLLSILPLAFPGTAFGIGLIHVWNTEHTSWVYGSWLIMLLLYVGQFFPFIVLLMTATFQQVNQRYWEAAQMVSASRLFKWRRIMLPLIFKGVIVSLLMGIILCFRELSGTLLVIPPGKETVSLRIYSLMHYGAMDIVAVLGLAQLLLTFSLVLGATCILRKLSIRFGWSHDRA